MNNVSEKKKDSILKVLAITGFIGIIILIAWISVKFVSIAPGAFSSLASLAEGLQQSQSSTQSERTLQTFTVSSDHSLINVGGLVKLSWQTTKSPGSYIFSYACTEGVAIDLINIDGLKSIDCDTAYNLGEVSQLSLTVNSEKHRYADVAYTISFIGKNDTAPRANGTSSVTVVNSGISSLAAVEAEAEAEEMISNVASILSNSFRNNLASTTSTDPEVAMSSEAETETENISEISPAATEPADPVVTTPPSPTQPVYQPEFVYEIPQSDPNGRTDLGTRFISIGTIIGTTFFAEELKRGDRGAVQFAVKNHGSKTSNNWTYTISLPNGQTYTSQSQTPLKPNEEATLTIGFNEITSSEHTFVATINDSTDQNSLNDRLVKTVQFAN